HWSRAARGRYCNEKHRAGFPMPVAPRALLLTLFAAASAIAQPAPDSAPAPDPQPAAAPATEPAAAAPPPVAGDANRQLSDRIAPEQQLWLQAGEERFFARFVPDLTGAPRGAVLILHDAGQHPSWPLTVAALFE